jgi:hypothetical protein
VFYLTLYYDARKHKIKYWNESSRSGMEGMDWIDVV